MTTYDKVSAKKVKTFHGIKWVVDIHGTESGCVDGIAELIRNIAWATNQETDDIMSELGQVLSDDNVNITDLDASIKVMEEFA